jgi:hypothetical protein
VFPSYRWGYPRRVARIARSIAIVVAAGVLSGCGDLSRAELKRGVESLAALAAEGRLVARDVADDRTKATFVRVHARALAEDAEHEQEKLGDARPDPAVRSQRAHATELAGMLSDSLSALAVAPGDERDARARMRELAAVAHRIDDLARSL